MTNGRGVVKYKSSRGYMVEMSDKSTVYATSILNVPVRTGDAVLVATYLDEPIIMGITARSTITRVIYV
jgi:hypothetical protein